MEKLTPKDIKIKARGKQIREYIEDKYGSLEEFSKVFGNTEGTIEYYCRTSDLGTDDFRAKLVTTLDKGIDELAPDRKTQITNFVNSILHNYIKYRDKKDLEVIEKVMKLCKEEKMEVEQLTMERNKAMYYFNNKRTEQAIEMMVEIIKKARKRKLHYHWIYFSCDLAVMYGFIGDIKKAQKIYTRLRLEERGYVKDDEFKDKALYKYHYHRGVLYNRVGKHDKAKMMFEESLNYMTRDTDEGVSIVSIGLSCKKKGEYDKALEYYFKALEVQPSVEKKVKILNNIAEVYKQMEQYDMAMEYIDRAMDDTEFDKVESKYIAYVTYLEIKFLMGNTEEILEELINWATEGSKEQIPRSYILIALNSVINLAKQVKSYDYLVKVVSLIMEIGEQSGEKAFILELDKYVGNITRFFYKSNNIRGILGEKENIWYVNKHSIDSNNCFANIRS